MARRHRGGRRRGGADLAPIDRLPAALDLNYAKNKSLGAAETFTRASTATYFDSAGVLQSASTNEARFDHTYRTVEADWVSRGLLIEEQRTNECQQSADLSTTWVIVNATVSTDAAVGPDGNTVMDKLIEDSDTNQIHEARETASKTAAAETWTASIYAKAAERTLIRLHLTDAGTADACRADYDLSAGTVGSVTNDGTFTAGVASIIDVGNGIYRCIMTGTTNADAVVGILPRLMAGPADSQYDGDGTSGAYLWGAQLEKGAFPTSYIPTTTTSATRAVDVCTTGVTWFNASAGTFYLETSFPYVDTAATKLLTIDDGSTADRIYFERDAAENINFATINSGDTNGASDDSVIHATNETIKIAGAYADDDVIAYVDATSSGADSAAAIPLGDTMTTLRIGADSAGSTCGHIARVVYFPSRLANAVLEELTKEYYDPTLSLQYSSFTSMAEVEAADPAGISHTVSRSTTATYFDSDGVLQTAATNTARFDHVYDGTSWVNKGLLVEEQRTNLCLQSEDHSTTWTTSNLTITSTASVAPDGNAADKLEYINPGDLYQDVTITADTVYCYSAYVKAVSTHDWVRIFFSNTAGSTGVRVWYNIQTGVVGTAATFGTGTLTASGIIDAGGGWYRIWFAGKVDAATTTARLRGVINHTADGSFTEDTEATYAWGYQFEQGAFPTSYIPTTTVGVARNADSITSTDVAWLDQSKGTFLVKAYLPILTNANSTFFYVDDGGATDRIWLRANSSEKSEFTSTNSGGNDGSSIASPTFSAATDFKAIGAFQQDDFVAGLDGTLDASPDTAADFPTSDALTTLRIGRYHSGANILNGHISAIVYWPKRRPDASLTREST